MKKIQNNQEIPIPEGLEQRLSALVDRLEAEEKGRKTKPNIRRTLYALAAAACILLLLIFHFSQEPAEEKPVLTEVVEQPAPENSEFSESPDYSNNSEPSEPIKPIKPKKTYKSSRSIEEPMLAEAEPIQEEIITENEQEYLPTEPDPFLLAAAEAQDIRSRGERLFQKNAQTMNNH